jgi:(S)-ureidoglycine aminohydrolase
VIGARFTEYTAELEAGGELRSTGAQRFAFVVDGNIRILADGKSYDLATDGYAYAAPNDAHRIIAVTKSRIVVIEKPYQSEADLDVPDLFVSHAHDVTPQALNGDPDLQVQVLLPEKPQFDFAMNLMTFQPGASLSLVEIHVMEHGLVMLNGGGIYRLDECWYPVTAGDFIWMAPYCPQWFGALGKQPARYLIYKDWNRLPEAR